MNCAQRWVLVVALGVALFAGWAWWYTGEVGPWARGPMRGPGPGPTQTDTYFVVVDRQPEHLLVPLLLIALWTAASVALLASRSPTPSSD